MSAISRSAEAGQSGLVLVMVSAVLWGTVGVATKALYGLTATNPLSIGFFRLAVSVPVLWVACWWAVRGKLFHIAPRDLGVMVLMGAMTALYQVFYFGAIERVGVSVAVLITLCTAPVIVAVLSAVITGERLTGRVALALVCALVGTFLLIDFQPQSGSQAEVIIGVLLALGSATGYAIITLTSRALAGRFHPLQPIAIGFSVGAVLLFGLTLPLGLVVDYPTSGWFLLLYLGVIPTALAYALFLAGMRSTPATVASIVTLVEPLTSTVLAWLFFDEQFSPLGWLGAVLLCGAMLVLMVKQRK